MDLPEIDDSVPTFDENASKRGRWGRPLKDGVHVAELVSSKLGFRQDKGEALISLGFVVDGTPADCPEGSVRADLDIALPPNAKFPYRNFLDVFFPGKKKCSEEELKSLAGSKVEILTHFSPAKGAYKAKNWIDKLIAVKDRAASSGKPAEADPFDAPAPETATSA